MTIRHGKQAIDVKFTVGAYDLLHHQASAEGLSVPRFAAQKLQRLIAHADAETTLSNPPDVLIVSLPIGDEVWDLLGTIAKRIGSTKSEVVRRLLFDKELIE